MKNLLPSNKLRWQKRMIRGAFVCLTIALIALYFLLTGCATCRALAVNNARLYQAQGYDVRISVYCVGIDGRIMGMGIWSSHVQAQVKIGDGWLWIDNAGQVSDTTEFSLRPMAISATETHTYIWWSLSDYEDLLLRRSEIMQSGKNPCDLF